MVIVVRRLVKLMGLIMTANVSPAGVVPHLPYDYDDDYPHHRIMIIKKITCTSGASLASASFFLSASLGSFVTIVIVTVGSSGNIF